MLPIAGPGNSYSSRRSRRGGRGRRRRRDRDHDSDRRQRCDRCPRPIDTSASSSPAGRTRRRRGDPQESPRPSRYRDPVIVRTGPRPPRSSLQGLAWGSRRGRSRGPRVRGDPVSGARDCRRTRRPARHRRPPLDIPGGRIRRHHVPGRTAAAASGFHSQDRVDGHRVGPSSLRRRTRVLDGPGAAAVGRDRDGIPDVALVVGGHPSSAEGSPMSQPWPRWSRPSPLHS